MAACAPLLALLLGDVPRGAALIVLASVATCSAVVIRLHRARSLLEEHRRRLEGAVRLLDIATEARSGLLDGLAAAGEDERSWVAAELHDGPIQLLAALGFGIDRTCQRISKGETYEAGAMLATQRDELTRVITDLRALIPELSTGALDDTRIARRGPRPLSGVSARLRGGA